MQVVSTDHVSSSSENSGPEVDVSRGSELLAEEPPDSRVRSWILETIENLNLPACDVSVRIVTTEEISTLNSEYRQKSEPTNVLSFEDGFTDENGRVFLGDIVLCNEVVQKESERYGKSFEERYAHLLIHGLLHLLGYDHGREDDRLKMEQLEMELLASLGFSNPYEAVQDE